MTKITIVGAGLAGLLAANMLPAGSSHVIEAQPSLPHNHNAVLRFRTSVVGDVLGVPFRKVQMIKATATSGNPVADALRYSSKAFGQYRSDRSLPAAPVVAERFIAPPDLVERMAAPLGPDRVTFGADFVSSATGGIYYDTKDGMKTIDGPIISTIPMPRLMSLLGYPDSDETIFRFTSGNVIRARVRGCDAFASLYTPRHSSVTRISITGDELIIEIPSALSSFGVDEDMKRNILGWACREVGLIEDDIYEAEVHKQHYAKIAPIPEQARRAFLHWASDKHNVFGLGRFATWRPGLLLDDLVKDVRLIQGWAFGDRYDMVMARQR